MPRHTSNNASSSSRRMLYMAAQAGEAVQEVQDDDMIDIEIREEHTIRVHETEDYFKAESTVNEHNRRLMRMIQWIQENYPAYAERGVIELDEAQKRDTKRYHKSTHDFVYQRLNPEVIKSFLSDNKYKPDSYTMDGNPIMYSYTHIQKYHDAILFGAFRAKRCLSQKYLLEIKTFLDSKKKETTKAKKKGEVEEYEADPISFELYRLLCNYAINDGDIFTWAYTVVQ